MLDYKRINIKRYALGLSYKELSEELIDRICLRIAFLFPVFGGRWCGNPGGIYNRTLFRQQSALRQQPYHLSKQLFL